MSPQQLGYSICPLKIDGGTATALLDGYISKKRGGDWRAAFVGVKPGGNPVYGNMVKTGGKASIETAGLEKLYLVVAAIPTKMLAINMTGDFRSFEQEKFPFKLQLSGCSPLDLLANEKPATGGTAHPNGGGFVANAANVEATAYVGPNAQVLGNAKVMGLARIEDYAVVNGATVRGHAVVSDHALVEGNSIVEGHAKIRDWGLVTQGATVKDYAKVIEHGTQRQKVCSGYAVIKGVARSSGNVGGTGMIDGSYAKGNEVNKGKWFTWSWGKGKNPGEVDKEFGGIYVHMSFDDPHEWMARDDFGATWGYLAGNPEIKEDPDSVKLIDTADVTEDATRFVLPRDPNQKNPNAAHRWDHYGSLMRGYLHPPVTGEYAFWVYADDNGVVSLSTDSNPENRRKICSSRVSGMNNYEKFPEQKSNPVHLEKGKVYYIEALFKAAGGGDYMGVAWEYEGQQRTIIEGKYLSKTADGPAGTLGVQHWHRIGGGSVDQLINNPRFARGLTRTSNSVLTLNGNNQFVEFQDDVADMRDITIKATVNWQGTQDAAILEFSNDDGGKVFLGVKDGRCVFFINNGEEKQSLTGPPLKANTPTDLMVVLSSDLAKIFINDKEAAVNRAMSLNPDSIRATECYLGRGRDGEFFKGFIDNFEIYSVPLKDEIPPTPDPARLSDKPIFVNPETVVIRAETGLDPLGGVEYFFEETSGNPGGDDSGWTTNPTYKDAGLQPGMTYTYTVKMRDTGGNTTKPSAPANAKWEGRKAFTSTDGKTIVIEAENFTRSVPGNEGARGIEWKLSKKDEFSGNAMMSARPDRGVQIGDSYEVQSPRLDYLVHFPAAGRCSLWMRAIGPGYNSDSLYIGLDLEGTNRSLFHSGAGKAHWQKHRNDWSIHVKKPGVHTFSIWMREDGVGFDKFILTLDSGLAEPDSTGPEESPRK
jgi:hypothetical protein